MEEAKRSTERSQMHISSRQLDGSLLVFTLCLSIMILPTIALAAVSPAAAPSTATTVTASPPKATPPTTSAAAPPKSASASPPKLASPPVIIPASAPPPKPAAATPPASSTPPPAKSTVPAPKAAANLTSPPPAASTAPPKPSPVAPPKLPPAAPPSTPPALAPASPPTSPTDLDVSQLDALRALNVNFNTADPCKTSDDILLCDNSAPPRHLTSLSLKDCARSTNFSTQALFNLSTLQNLELVNCSVEPVHVPQILVKSLKTFICTASLGKTGSNEKAAKLSGVWLSTLTNLEELSVTEVEVSVSGLNIIVQDMKGLTQLMMPRVNMPGVLPKKTWPAGLEYIDVSGNSIRGTLPSQMRSLTQLKHLDMSDNQIKGMLPNIFNDLSQLQYINLAGNQFSGPIPGSLASLRNCSHLDLSNNQLNGTIPANLTSIRTLRYLDLSQNELTGPIPFNSTFLNRLTTLKLNGNTNLCYNHTALKSKFLTGIRNCLSLADNSAAFAPAPGPDSSLAASSSKSGHVSKGAAVGISVVVIVVAAAVIFVVRKWWKSRGEGDEFENLRAQKDRT